jgi:DoxX-like family
MATATQSALVSTKMLWAGRIVCGFVVLFLLMDSGMKVMKVAPAMRGTVQLGYSVSLVPIMGIILSACTALYAIPRTCVLGAILLTGYLGGAVGEPVAHWRTTLLRRAFPRLFRSAALGRTLFARQASTRPCSSAKSARRTCAMR